MKKLLFLFGIIALISSCGPDYKSEVERLKREQDSIKVAEATKDSIINSYMVDINEIKNNINFLIQQEGMMMKSDINNPELNENQKFKIISNIAVIRSLIDENKNKLAALKNKISKSNIRIEELEKMIASLYEELDQRDSSIASLNSNISNLQSEIDKKIEELELAKKANDNQSKDIGEKTSLLHTAYYVVGNYKDLSDKKVISKKGGLLGLGKSKSMVQDFNEGVFTKIDYTSSKLIDIVSKHVEIISTHPANSYKLVKQGDKIMALDITDPEKFWSVSKCLVVVTR
jgi:DNA repair exonuclease SbcCD ATPase subunit